MASPPEFAIDCVEKPIGKPGRYGLQESSWSSFIRPRASKEIMEMKLLPDFDQLTRKETGVA
jgi:hypothetical protein